MGRSHVHKQSESNFSMSRVQKERSIILHHIILLDNSLQSLVAINLGGSSPGATYILGHWRVGRQSDGPNPVLLLTV